MDYIDILLIALVTIFIVDVSGFTQSWRRGLAHLLKVKPESLRELKPFDCGLCMTFWVCNILALYLHTWSIPMLAFIALLSHLSFPIGQMMIFIREWLLSTIGKMIDNL